MEDQSDQSDLYRRIDDLLSKPIDEQVREQRALMDLMVSVRDAIARLTGDVAALAARVSETREFAERLADRPPPEPVVPAAAELPNEIAARLDALEGTIGGVAASVGELSGRVGRVADSMENMPPPRAEAPDLSAVPAALRDLVPDAVREAVPEAVRSAVEAQLSRLTGSTAEERAEVSAAMTEAMVNLRGELDRALSATWAEVRAALAASAEAIKESSARSVEGLGARIEEMRRGNDDRSKDLAPVVESLRAVSDLPSAVASLTGAVEAMRTSLGRPEEIPAAVDKALADGRATLIDAIRAATAEVRKEAAETIERVRSEVTLALERSSSLADAANERLGESSALALGRIGETGANAFDRFDGVAAAVEREISRLPRAIMDVVGRMDEFQETMLAYLAARDLALEEARDRVLEELLDEYAAGLGNRQRKHLGAALRRAFARRKDRRDAERYRSEAEPDAPRMPDVPRDSLERAATAIADRMAAPGPAAPVPRAVPRDPSRPAPGPVEEAPARGGSRAVDAATKEAPRATPKPVSARPQPVPQAKPPAPRTEPKPPATVAAKPSKPPAPKPAKPNPPAAFPAKPSSAVKPSAPKPAKPKASTSKPARGKGATESLAARLAADAKRTAERLSAEAKVRQEAERKARTESAEAARSHEKDRS